jgi:hypothetical protein
MALSMFEPIPTIPGSFVLDIGGEGRHPGAWNLNPRRQRTLGRAAGEPIPRLIQGRGDSIPLADESVDLIIVERTPLRPAMLLEMRRVAKPSATAILRHAVGPLGDPHRTAVELLQSSARHRTLTIGRRTIRETIVSFASA